MADHTKIEWTDATWNPIVGCSVISPGCTNCYAMRLAGTRMLNHPTRQGLTFAGKAGPVWNGDVRLIERALPEPLRWGRPRRIFVGAHTDIFHDAVSDAWLDRLFATMALSPRHTFQVLTKRPARMRDYLSTRAGDWMIKWPDANPPGALPISRHEQRLAMQGAGWPDAILRPTYPLPNVWLGVSIEDQRRADERVPILLDTPAAIRWVSAEPMLGPIDLRHFRYDGGAHVEHNDALTGISSDTPAGYRTIGAPRDPFSRGRLDWVVAGGESGPEARPMHPDWARSLRDHCAAADVSFFFKQWGEWEVSLDRDRDDPDWRRDYSRDYVDEGKSRWLNIEGGCGFHGDRFHVMRRVGKRASGRLLDGFLHDAYPEVRHA